MTQIGPDDGRSGPLPVAYQTEMGFMLEGTIEEALDASLRVYTGQVDLIFTSPPFPLNRKKKYGNLSGDEYLAWLQGLAPRLASVLKPTGSLVMEIGNAWEPGKPIMSLLPLKALMAVLESGDLNLCQQFVCHNKARLPSPAPWVTIKRSRVKDTFTNVWWMSPSLEPEADNRRVLREYSPAMKQLLARQEYNSGKRPSGFDISPSSFLTRNGGAISPNALEFEPEPEDDALPEAFLTYANTTSQDDYSRYCRESGIPPHPARMPAGLPKFFIEFLTRPGDIVLDPFGGSNMTGAVAERLGRRWISVEPDPSYIEGSLGRFPQDALIG